MLIEGEKWACESCVRGHRVSNCQHHDRPLQHINKKGRPVTQCSHCRAMRKSRTSHVKCDCGEKTHKCMHLTLDGHKEGCCCNHGGHCTCSHKKEGCHLDTVPESESEDEAPAKARCAKADTRSRRRANTTRSEGSILLFDDNGHHKPTHKLIRASQKSGPYQVARTNSMPQNRSADNLSSMGYGESPNSSSSADGGPRRERKARSAAGSPLMTGSSTFSQLNGQLPPLDLSAIEYPPYVSNSADFFGNLSDHEQPMFSAGLSSASVDWSHYDGLEFASKEADLAPSNYSQPQSYGGFDFTEQVPTLTTTTSTSGEVSEVEDYLSNGLDEFDTNSGFRDSAASSMLNLASTQANTQTSLLGSADLTTAEFDSLKYLKADNKYLPTPSSLAAEDSALASSASSGPAAFSLDESEFWMNMNGLPTLTDSPEPSFWDQ